jgi:uncharacterized SAM-binding protein YcdF (DUF218 family)
MPLDETTPSVDMVYRVLKGIELLNAQPGSVLIMTGGKTAGPISEARMMGLMACARDVNPDRIVLEERSRTTVENAAFTAEIFGAIRMTQILVVSRQAHLEWAIPEFHKYPVFQNARGVASEISYNVIIRQMEDYLQKHPDNEMVKERLNNIRHEIRGID